MNNTGLSDEVLWCRLVEGDDESFSRLFERYYASLLRYGKSFINDTDKVQDCIQDVFVDIWHYKSSLCKNVSVKAYLFSCLRKRIGRPSKGDHIFRRSTSIEDVSFSIEFTVEDYLISTEETATKVYQLNKHINLLPPRQKEALFLKYNQELKTEQIADILSINYQSANNLLHRAVSQLRKDIKGEFVLLVLVFIGFI